jgi:hypothetical protein
MRWRYRGVLALPFVAGVLALRAASAPLGDAVALSLARTVPAVATSSVRSVPLAAAEDRAAAGESVLAGPTSARAAALPSRPVEPATKDGAVAAPSLTEQGPKGTFIVPAAAVARALERRDVAATNALDADGSPLGARLVGVSRYGTGLRDGDVVVGVGGARTPTVAAMVSAALAAAGSGGNRLSGRILRGAAVHAVILELPTSR